MTMTDVDLRAQRATAEQATRDLLARCDPRTVDAPTFLGAQFDAGLAWVHFAPGEGGMDLDVGAQATVRTLLDAAGAPSTMRVNPVAYGQAGGAIHEFGTDAQRARWLRPMFTCDDLWCQLFSEPGAGSDLAALATSAVRDGDEWLLNGQKVWSSSALHARWAIVLARTNPGAPKHRGLTLFVVEMGTSGVDIRPIKEMTGGAHFNEVFLDDVRVPDDLRIGDVDMGWAVSMGALRYERALAADFLHDDDFMGPVLASWAAAPPERRSGPIAAVERDRIAGTWVEAEVVRALLARTKAADLDGAISKLAVSKLRQRVARLQLDLLGAAGQVGVDYTGGGTSFAGHVRSAQETFLNSPSSTIAAGTSEVMRNIIGERILGLPGEPRVDKQQPWRDLPRS
jgi:alkylation response protein AidB-like acyl-CoA dehydrogenase